MPVRYGSWSLQCNSFVGVRWALGYDIQYRTQKELDWKVQGKTSDASRGSRGPYRPASSVKFFEMDQELLRVVVVPKSGVCRISLKYT